MGWVGEYKNKNSKMRLLHPEYGVWESLSLDKMLQGRKHRNDRVKALIASVEVEEAEIIASFKTENKVFCKGEKINTWNYTCSICSHDEYVSAGVCSGVFRSNTNTLRAGGSSCRCSGRINWTPEQREFQVKKRIKEKNLPFTVISVTKRDVVYECSLHGRSSADIGNFLKGSYCKGCAGSEHLYSYILKVMDGDTVLAIKLGVSNNPRRRVACLNSRNKLKCEIMYLFEYETTAECLEAEKICKKTLDCGIISRHDMPEGYTETTSVSNVDKVLAVFSSKARLINGGN